MVMTLVLLILESKKVVKVKAKKEARNLDPLENLANQARVVKHLEKILKLLARTRAPANLEKEENPQAKEATLLRNLPLESPVPENHHQERAAKEETLSPLKNPASHQASKVDLQENLPANRKVKRSLKRVNPGKNDHFSTNL